MFLKTLGAAGLFGAGVWLGRALPRTASTRHAAPAPEAKPAPQVRDAGPDAMAKPPQRWDVVDQQADESFPASDPPGNY